MPRRFAQVDVFGSGSCSGNPVAVVLDAEGLSTEAMQRFARWTNLSETTFVLPPDDPVAHAPDHLAVPTHQGRKCRFIVLLDETLQESLPLIFEFLGVGDPERPVPRKIKDGTHPKRAEEAARVPRHRVQAHGGSAQVLVGRPHRTDDSSVRSRRRYVSSRRRGRHPASQRCAPTQSAEWLDTQSSEARKVDGCVLLTGGPIARGRRCRKNGSPRTWRGWPS